MEKGGTDEKLLEILVSENYLAKEDADAAQAFAKKHHVSPIDYLKREDLVTADIIGQAVAESYGLKFADMNTHLVTREQVLIAPAELGLKYRAVVFAQDSKNAVVATDLPGQPGLAESFGELLNKKVVVAYALTEDINQALQFYRQSLNTRFTGIIEGGVKVAPELVQTIFDDALVNGASDVHFEPEEDEITIRFRVDGILHEVGTLPLDQYEAVLNRIKVLAHMPIDEHFSAQDGAIRFTAEDGQDVDLRVSIAPTMDGEKVTVRLLSSYISQFSLTELGLSSDDQQQLAKSSKKPFGMIITTGPTGSGKTTTLYSVVKELKRPEVNITTIEDPVEYKIRGINQIQVNPTTNLTFAKGLRSIARQDPDVILVGEIRDEETAEIAVNASLTGHLLLSTFHANDAATAIPRLLDMSIEPFLLASTLELVIAQRLVRKIHESCRVGREYTKEELTRLHPEIARFLPNRKSITLYEAKPTQAVPTGFSGRTAIVEMIHMTPDLRELILHNPSRNEIWAQARKDGAQSMFEDGIEKVLNGVTTLDELLRVVPVPEA